MDQGLVEITFELKDFKTVDGCTPAITGNVVELGEWRPERAVKAEKILVENQDGDIEHGRNEPIWVCTAKIPADTEFDWSWAVLSPGGTFRSIEEQVFKRYSTVYFNKVFSQTWEENVYSPIKVSRVVLNTHYIVKDKTQKLAIVGSHPALGCWMPERYIQAVESPPQSASWRVESDVPKNVFLLWKWVVFDIKSNQIIRWEERKNRILFVRTDSLTANAPWNSGEEAQIIGSANNCTDNIVHAYSATTKRGKEKSKKGNLYEAMQESKLPHGYSGITLKVDKKIPNQSLQDTDAISSDLQESSFVSHVVTEDADGKISIHKDRDDAYIAPHQNAHQGGTIDAPYCQKSPMLEHKHLVRRSINTPCYNKGHGCMQTKTLYHQEDGFLFKLRLKKTATKLPSNANGYFYELQPIPISKAKKMYQDKLKNFKSKVIVKNVTSDTISGCAQFTLNDNHNVDVQVFKESSVDVPLGYNGILNDLSSWKIVGLRETDVDTGLEEQFDLYGRLRQMWHNYMHHHQCLPFS